GTSAATCEEEPFVPSLNVWIQTPSYVLIALSEIFASVTSLEYAYTKAPKSMRSMVMGCNLFTTALAAAIGEAFLPISADPLLVWNYGVMAGLSFVGGIGFWFNFRNLDKTEREINEIEQGAAHAETMGFLGFHHFGTFLLFTSSILLLVGTITSPLVNDLSLLTIKTSLSDDNKVTLGALGGCLVRDDHDDHCTDTGVGYDASELISDSLPGVRSLSDTVDNVTSALVLHPICCGLAFLAFLVAAASYRFGFIFAALTAAFTWVITLVLVIVDIVLFTVLKHKADDIATVSAHYGAGFWCTVAALILLFIASFATCFSCFSDRRTKRVENRW
ncbi:hypothetical protein JCM6882_001546, partial [Rhodosporidiobolus microsporus]